MGMTEHWNWAISQARGAWLTVLGDDDGLVPGALAAVDRVLQNDPDIEFVRGLNATYVWPGVTPGGEPTLAVPVQRSGDHQPDVSFLARRAPYGEISWRQLPMIYTGGWVRMRSLHGTVADSGEFLRAISPDVYSGVALAHVLRRTVTVNQVLAITGCSPHSNGRSAENGELSTPGTTSNQFIKDTNYRTHSALCPTSPYDAPTSDYCFLLDSWLHAEHLHQGAKIDWARCVEELCVSAMQVQHEASRIAELARAQRVSGVHGVDWQRALQSAIHRRRSHYRSMQTAVRNWRLLTSQAVFGGRELGIHDVFEASIKVDQIMNCPPSYLRRALHAARFGASRVLPRIRAALRRSGANGL
jgi:hypothetical protein